MTRPSYAHAVAAVRRRHARHGGDASISSQGGYLLLYVLGIIAFTSVVVIALLGLALTSARVAAMEARVARETRAADGALEAQLAGVSASGGDVCASFNPTQNGGEKTVKDFSGGIDVQVSCGRSGVSDNPTATLDGPDVELVGQTPYTGGVTPIPAVAGFSDPTLVVAGVAGGPRAARFESDVYVTRGAAPTAATGPAVWVAGQYQQGATVGGSGCGALEVAGVQQIVDGGGAGVPTCGTAPNIAPSVQPSLPSSGGGRSIACAPGGTVQLDQGTYSSADIKALNAIFGGTQACTVIFKPGVHYLDVYDDSKADPAARTTLTISNKNVQVIGGQPLAGGTFPIACDAKKKGAQLVLSPRSAFRHTGGRVALCPRYVGDDGRSLSDPVPASATALPVIIQSLTQDQQPTWAGLASSANFNDPANLAPGSTAMARGRIRTCIPHWFLMSSCTNAGAAQQPTFTSKWATNGDGPLKSARVLMNLMEYPSGADGADDDPASYHEVDLRVEFTLTTVSSGSCSTGSMYSGRAYGETMAYDLFSGACSTFLAGKNQTVLNGASLSATFSSATPNADSGILDPMLFGLRIEARNVRLSTNGFTVVGSGTPQVRANMTTGTPPIPLTWSNPSAVHDADNSVASLSGQVSGPLPVSSWANESGVVADFTVQNLSLPSGLNADDGVKRLGVLLRGPASPTDKVPFLTDPNDNSELDITLLRADGTEVCTAHRSSYSQSNQFIRYDLLDASGCAGKISKAGELQNAKLRFRVKSGCAQPKTVLAGQCVSVNFPKVDQIALDVGTDSVSARPPYSTVTVDVASNTSFNVFGPVEMPISDLDVHWAGDPGTRPIFDGRLQLHGLGVTQDTPSASVGAVCCSLRGTDAVFVARVNGAIRAQATVRVAGDVVGTETARRKVDVLSWKLCGRAGC